MRRMEVSAPFVGFQPGKTYIYFLGWVQEKEIWNELWFNFWCAAKLYLLLQFITGVSESMDRSILSIDTQMYRLYFQIAKRT